MLKKLMLLGLVAALAVALLPTLGGNVAAQDDGDTANVCGTDEDVEIAIIAGSVGQEGEIVAAQVERFEELCPNVSVDVIARSNSATETLGQYLQFFEAESGDVDVYQIDVIWPGILAEHLLDLNEYLSEDLIGSHFNAIVDNNTVDGRLVGLPWFTDAGLLYFRTDLLDRYDLDVPVTWEELTESAEIIQEGERSEGNEDFFGFVWQGNAYEGLTCDALEWQASSGGGVIIGADGEVQVNNDETIEMFDLAASWVGGISPEGVTGYGEEEARSVFQAGNAAFMRNWPYAYSLGNSDDSPIAGLFDVSTLPGAEEGMTAATLGGWQLGVSQYSDNPDAAVALAAFLASEDEQKIRAIEGSYNPTIGTLYEDADVLDAAPFFGSLFDVFTNATARPSTVSAEEYGTVSELYFTAVHSVLTGQSSAEDAMAVLEADLLDVSEDFFVEE